MPFTLTVFCLAIVTVSVLGGMLPLATVLNHTRLQVYLSFAAGAMLGAAFFHMLPEAVRLGGATMIPWAAVGLLALFFLERFFSYHQHESHGDGESGAVTISAPHESADHQSGHHSCDGDAAHTSAPETEAHPATWRALPWGSTAFGLVVHSLVGGVALASAVAADFEVGSRLGAAGLGVFIATLVHKPADALTITSLMIRAGSRRSLARLVNLGFSLMIPLGVALFALGIGGMHQRSSVWTAGALAFSAGTFLCISLSDLLPELQFHSHDRLKLSIALLAGLGLMAGAAAFEPTEHAPSTVIESGTASPPKP